MIKIGFFGTADFSASLLEPLINNESVKVELIVSQSDKPVGRKRILEETSVKKVGKTYNIEVLQPEKLSRNEEFLSYLESKQLDIILVVAYGKIVPKRVLSAAKYWCVNIHWSILPLYRWASPIQEAIKNWDTKTWLTIIYMSQWMDEWDILDIEEIAIDKDDTTSDIFEKFSRIWPDLALKSLHKIINNEIVWIQQDDSQATYCTKIEKEDGHINVYEQKAQQIYNYFRAYSVWPGIFAYYEWTKLNIEWCYAKSHDIEYDEDFGCGDVVEFECDWKKEIAILCQEGALVLTHVKLAGKKSMDIMSFVNGNKAFLDYKF